ncbi:MULTISPECIES: hypothetical protein [Pseudomonas]|uniref:hypothetical protein n=1 Tax=Pseudomonas TaxID=286 RepID=UPI00143B22E4|nr:MULTISPECIES: hypothetical protein [Pseudomonas]MBF7143774.1 hypothetical protein [Pseudomonas sp. LY10J]
MPDTTSLVLDTTLPVLDATHPVGVCPALLDDRLDGAVAASFAASAIAGLQPP